MRLTIENGVISVDVIVNGVYFTNFKTHDIEYRVKDNGEIPCLIDWESSRMYWLDNPLIEVVTQHIMYKDVSA